MHNFKLKKNGSFVLGLKQRLATEEKLLEEEQENDVVMVTATEDENNIDHSKLSYIKI